MADSKRITVCFPVSLLEEMDLLIDAENKCRSELVREAMRFYLWEKKENYIYVKKCEKVIRKWHV